MIRHLLSQFFQVWLLPPGIFILMGFIGFLAMFRWRRLGMIWIAGTFGSLWILSMPAAAWFLINPLQSQYPSLEVNGLTPSVSSIILVLGAGSNKNALEYASHENISDPTLSRLNYAAYLYRKTGWPILVSGGGDNDASTPTADLMLGTLRENFDIHSDPRLKENKSLDTADEALILAVLLKQHKANKIYLVTNAWHMPRAMYAFKQTGVEVIPAPMGYIAPRSEDQLSDYLPSFTALHTSMIAMREYIGLLWYRIIIGRVF